MELPPNLVEKYRRPVSKKSGGPRCERDELIDKFLAVLNPKQIADGRKPYTAAYIARIVKGYTDADLYQLYQQCSAPGVLCFGAMMTYKIKNRK